LYGIGMYFNGAMSHRVQVVNVNHVFTMLYHAAALQSVIMMFALAAL